mgnify:CR=1 FL=1
MPELPEVETVRRGLSLKIGSRRIIGVEKRRDNLRKPFPEKLAARLIGSQIIDFGRRGKYLLLGLDSDDILIIHLGMSGRILLTFGNRPPLDQHDHLVIDFEDGLRLVYNDPRRFGLVDIINKELILNHRLLHAMGPEPLSPDFDFLALSKKLEGRKTSIKAALLDQRIIAGIGNIYACEALFYARLSPRRLASNVQGKRAEHLVLSIKTVLEKAIAAGGSSLKDYVNTSGGLGYFQHGFTVYGRENQACKECGNTVKRIVQNGRSTFFCPHHQR